MDCRTKAGRYLTPSLAKEGFIHCSTRAQVLPVADKFYKGQSGLIVLGIDPARLSFCPEVGTAFRGRASARCFPQAMCSRISMALSIWMPSFSYLIWNWLPMEVLFCPPSYDFDSPRSAG